MANNNVVVLDDEEFDKQKPTILSDEEFNQASANPQDERTLLGRFVEGIVPSIAGGATAALGFPEGIVAAPVVAGVVREGQRQLYNALPFEDIPAPSTSGRIVDAGLDAYGGPLLSKAFGVAKGAAKAGKVLLFGDNAAKNAVEKEAVTASSALRPTLDKALRITDSPDANFTTAENVAKAEPVIRAQSSGLKNPTLGNPKNLEDIISNSESTIQTLKGHRETVLDTLDAAIQNHNAGIPPEPQLKPQYAGLKLTQEHSPEAFVETAPKLGVSLDSPNVMALRQIAIETLNSGDISAAAAAEKVLKETDNLLSPKTGVREAYDAIDRLDDAVALAGGYNKNLSGKARVLVDAIKEAKNKAYEALEGQIGNVLGVVKDPALEGMPPSVIRDINGNMASWISMKQGAEEALVRLSNQAVKNQALPIKNNAGTKLGNLVKGIATAGKAGAVREAIATPAQGATRGAAQSQLAMTEAEIINEVFNVLGRPPVRNLALPRTPGLVQKTWSASKQTLLPAMASSLVRAGLAPRDAVAMANQQLDQIEPALKNPVSQDRAMQQLIKLAPTAFEAAPMGYQSIQDNRLMDPLERDTYKSHILKQNLDPSREAEILLPLMKDGTFVPIIKPPSPVLSQPRNIDISQMSSMLEQHYPEDRGSRPSKADRMVEQLKKAQLSVDYTRSGL